MGSLGAPKHAFQGLAKTGQLQIGSKSIQYGVHKKSARLTGRISSSSLLGFTQRNAEISEGTQHTIGLDYLRRFLVTFDLANDRIFFAPNESFNAPWPRCDYSVGVESEQDRKTIACIERYSPASESGLQVGDELLSINDESVNDWPLGRVRKRLREADTDLELVITRFDEAMTIVLPRGTSASQ